MRSEAIKAVAFSQRGYELAKRMTEELGGQAARCGAEYPLKKWAEESFAQSGALIFVGAAGIAVRAIAPYLQNKANDPAVIVVDEQGKFVIPILSGHLGGANALARRVAAWSGGTAVITTATDLNGVFAVDEWAKRQNCVIPATEKIKEVSAALLAGRTIRVSSDFAVAGRPPQNVCLTEQKDYDVKLGLKTRGKDVLRLVPRIAVLGVGCKKNTTCEQLEHALEQTLGKASLYPQSICAAASISLKKREPGLLEFCAGHGWPLLTYSARQLAAVQGDFTSSAFVQKVTSVDNVCERSAVLASGGKLYSKKNAGNGVTMAVALKPYAPDWRWQDGS